MLEDDSRTPHRLKWTQGKYFCKMLKSYPFGDTILHGGHGIRDQVQNPAHMYLNLGAANSSNLSGDRVLHNREL